MTAPAHDPPTSEPPAQAAPKFLLTSALDPATIDAVARALLAEPARPEQVRRPPLLGRIAVYFGLAAAVGAGAAWFFDRNSVGSPQATVLGAILGVAIGAALAHALINRRTLSADHTARESVARYRQDALKSGTLRIECWDEGLRIHNDLGLYLCTWPGVRGVRWLGPVLVLELWPDGMVPLPPSSFRSPAERDEFVAFATAQIAAHGGGEAGFLRRVLATHQAACPKCRYALQGCDGSKCPECGLRLTVGLLGLPLPRSLGDLKVSGAPPAAATEGA